jgi:hypothetical protein
MTDNNNYLLRLTTLSGVNMVEAVKKMKEILPPRAYKKVGGSGVDLTDIDPAYLTQVATDLFGMCGVGWKYSFDPSLTTTTEETRTSRNSDRERNVFNVVIPYLTLQFRYLDENGNMQWSEPVPANGSNENENQGYALRGALTNAIGAAFAKLCWQLPVYQGRVDHNNAEALYKKYRERQAKNNGASTDGEDSAENETSAASTGEAVKKEEYQVPEMFAPKNGGSTAPTAEAPKEEPKAEPEPEAPKAPERVEQPATNGSHDTDWAKHQIIPEGIGVPLAGKELGVAVNDAMFGEAIVKFLSGQFANASGKKFDPKSDEHKALMEAAKLLLDTLPAKK